MSDTSLQLLREHVRCLIFDLDGTLTDSGGAIAANYQATFRHFGVTPPSMATILPYIGLQLDEVLRSLIPDGEHLPEATVQAWMATYRALYPSVALPATTLFPGVRATLERCRELGFTCAMATSKRRAAAFEVLDYCGIQGFFAEVAGGDVAPRSKPHPDMLEWLLPRIDHAPQEALMVGDTTFDLDMGRSAGAFTCGVTYGVHTETALRARRPDAIVEHFDEVLWVVGRA